MDLKEQIKTVISETCTHWLISDDAELKKVSKKLSKEFESIINAEIERRQPVPTKNNGLHKHDVSKQRELLIAYELHMLRQTEQKHRRYWAERTVDNYISNL